jgi:uracil-DNA glycosylase
VTQAIQTVRFASQTDFPAWRDAARRLATNDIAPADIVWSVGESEDLFSADTPLPDVMPDMKLNVPREFIDRAEAVICHSNPTRFALLYRILFRLRVEPNLLKIASDPDVMKLYEMEKSVRRDIHKMRAMPPGSSPTISSSRATRPSSCAASPAWRGRS